MSLEIVAGILIASIAPLTAYLIAARRFSGKIDSSDASELWKESRSIRDWSKHHIEELNLVIARLEARIGVVENQNVALRTEIVTLTAELKKSRERVDELEGRQNDKP